MRPDSPARDLGLIAVFAALIAAASVAPGVPVGPVPITLQTLAVMLTGLVLGPLRGLAATALYVGVGLAGLPVFAGGAAGLGTLVKPSAGYLLSFPLAALVAGALAKFVRARWKVGAGHATGIAAFVRPRDHPPLGIGLMVNAKLSLTRACRRPVRPGDGRRRCSPGIAATVHSAFPVAGARLVPVEAEPAVTQPP
jgi:biotin transport system substrate-specific component